MRVRIRIRRDERGSTAILMVAAMTVFFGMLAVAFDMGSVLVTRRTMVRAADAAALAAAQSCTLGHGVADAQAQANAYADSNQPGSNSALFEPTNCTANGVGQVKVEYGKLYELAIAGFLGMDDPIVGGQATAMFGPAGSARAIPATLEVPAVSACGFDANNIPENEDDEVDCHFMADDQQIGGGNWSFLNLDHWNVPPGPQADPDLSSACPHPGNKLMDWMVDGYPEVLAINQPQPAITYVCAAGGTPQPAWEALADQVGTIKIFPVTDPDTKLLHGASTSVDKYNVIGFIALRIKSVSRPHFSNESLQCQIIHLPPLNDGESLDLKASGEAAGCAFTDSSSLKKVTIKTAAGATVPGNRYDVDAGNWTLTWQHSSPSPPLDITIEYTNGKFTCGPYVAQDNAAVCLVLSWPGPQLGGSDPVEEGPLAGPIPGHLKIKAIRLSK